VHLSPGLRLLRILACRSGLSRCMIAGVRRSGRRADDVMKQQFLVILNLSLVSALVILGFAVISPVLPQYALSFSVPVALTGWAVSAYALARLLMDLPAGILADRFGRKRNMIAGLLLVIVSSALSGFAPTFAWLVIGRVVQGLGSAFYMTSATAWVAQVSAGEYRGRFMSLYSGLVFAGTAFGPTIGGYSAAHFGLNGPFFVYGGLAVLSLWATALLKEPEAKTNARRVSLTGVKTVLTNGPFLLVTSAVLALFFLRAGVRSTLVPLYASLNLGFSEQEIGLLLTVPAIVTTLVTIPAGWLSDRIGRRTPIRTCLFLSAVSVVLIPLLGTTAGALFAVMAFYGLATGLQGSIAAWPADVAPHEQLGTAMGVYRVVGDIGFFFGPITVTYIAGATGSGIVPTLPFVVPAVFALIVGVVLRWARDPVGERRRTTTA
jgi:DHA1 family multidrug resistance protein-like MFS transporter